MCVGFVSWSVLRPVFFRARFFHQVWLQLVTEDKKGCYSCDAMDSQQHSLPSRLLPGDPVRIPSMVAQTGISTREIHRRKCVKRRGPGA